MHTKIKELALQAGGSHYPDVNSAQLEKFAELIVRECMGVVSKKCASPTAYNALAEHFGVAE